MRLTGMARNRLGATTAAAVLAGAVLLGGCSARAADPGPTAVTTTTSSTTASSPPAGDNLAAIYAAALRGFIGRPSGGNLYLHDFTCPDLASQPATPDCGRRPIPADVSAALSRLLTGWASVHFLAWDDPVPYPATIVTLGSTRPRGSGVEQQVSYLCGGLCGQGATLVLAPSGGDWRVTGQTGPRWIS